MAAMHATRSLHPPARIDPLGVVVNDCPGAFWSLRWQSGACLLAAVAFLWHNLFRRGSWPARWW
jgi:CBS-domain-containing membrane protein